MWKDLDLEALAEEENRYGLPRPPHEVEQIVGMAWWELWNRGVPCGVPALRKRLDTFYHLKPLPSVRMIGRIVARNDRVNGR